MAEYYKDVTYEYVTLEGSFRINAKRHLERAIAYASAGYPDHYFEGSMKKAKRNLEKADSLNFKLMPWEQEIVDQISNRIIDNLLYGVLVTKVHGNKIEHVDLRDIYKC